MRRWVHVAFASLLIAAACGRGEPTSSPGGGAIRTVLVDGRTNRFNGSFLTYFPSEVTVSPGDTVSFKEVWSGEPHSVTFGVLVERALDEAKDYEAGDPVPPALAAIPSAQITKRETAPQNITRPCYLETGAPPAERTVPCPAVDPQPAFNGRQALYSSGFIPEKTRFRMKIADDIAPGRYRYFCVFHGPRMQGAVVVAPPGSEIPSQDEVSAAASKRLGELVGQTIPRYRQEFDKFKRARVGAYPFPALAGFEAADGLVRVNEFVPFTIKARRGETVSWSVLGPRTVSFDPPRLAKPPVINKRADGGVEFNAEAFRPVGGPGLEGQGVPQAPITIDAGRHDGEHTLSSGILFAYKHEVVQYAVRFTRPRSYRYECVVHPRMVGVVTVSL